MSPPMGPRQASRKKEPELRVIRWPDEKGVQWLVEVSPRDGSYFPIALAAEVAELRDAARQACNSSHLVNPIVHARLEAAIKATEGS